MRRVAFAVPGDLSVLTGGYAYDRRMIAELRKLGWQVDVIALGDGFPNATPEAKREAGRRLGKIPEGVPIVIDGLAYGVLDDVARDLCRCNPLIALVHHPLALETGVPPELARAFKRSEREALAVARGVVVTSPATAQALIDDYAVARERIVVACPGTERVPSAPDSSDGNVRLLSVGSIVPRKGFDILIAALAQLKDLPWSLTIAGDRTRDVETAARLDADIVRHGFISRVNVLGAQPEGRLAALYNSADVFVLASRYEGYGMAFAEALAHGLPIVGTDAGAIPGTVPASAGILVPPDDIDALARALRTLVELPAERRRLAAGAREAGLRLPTWEDSAVLLAKAIEAVA